MTTAINFLVLLLAASVASHASAEICPEYNPSACLHANNQNCATSVWSTQIIPATLATFVMDMAVDAVQPKPKIYVTGSTFGNVSNLQNKGFLDVFFVAFDANDGSVVVASSYGSNGNDQANAIAIDSTFAYIVGSTDSNVFNNMSKIATLNDAFLLCVSLTTGTVKYTKLFGGALDDFGVDVEIETSQGTGYLLGNTFNSLSGQNSAGSQDVFLLKFNASTGDQLLFKQFGSAEMDIATALDVDFTKEIVYFTGYTYGRFNTTVAQAGGSDIFVLALNGTNFNQTFFIQQFGSSGDDQSSSILVHSETNIGYIGGKSNGNFSAHFSTGLDDNLLMKIALGNFGALLSSALWGSTGSDSITDLTMDMSTGLLWASTMENSTAAYASIASDVMQVQSTFSLNGTSGGALCINQFGTSIIIGGEDAHYNGALWQRSKAMCSSCANVCMCSLDFSGSYCDSAADLCGNSECLNGATCIFANNTTRGYLCLCPSMLTGDNCDQLKYSSSNGFDSSIEAIEGSILIAAENTVHVESNLMVESNLYLFNNGTLIDVMAELEALQAEVNRLKRSLNLN